MERKFSLNDTSRYFNFKLYFELDADESSDIARGFTFNSKTFWDIDRKCEKQHSEQVIIKAVDIDCQK